MKKCLDKGVQYSAYFRRRGGRAKAVLLVTIRVRGNGGFEVLDWEGCSGDFRDRRQKI